MKACEAGPVSGSGNVEPTRNVAPMAKASQYSKFPILRMISPKENRGTKKRHIGRHNVSRLGSWEVCST